MVGCHTKLNVVQFGDENLRRIALKTGFVACDPKVGHNQSVEKHSFKVHVANTAFNKLHFGLFKNSIEYCNTD